MHDPLELLGLNYLIRSLFRRSIKTRIYKILNVNNVGYNSNNYHKTTSNKLISKFELMRAEECSKNNPTSKCVKSTEVRINNLYFLDKLLNADKLLNIT